MVVGQGSPQLHIRYRSHMQRKAMNGKNKETETCQGTHTHARTHTCRFMYTRYFVTVVGLCLCVQTCLTLCNPMDCSPQASLSMGFSRQEFCSGSLFSFRGDLSNPGFKLASSALQEDSISLRHLGILVI